MLGRLVERGAVIAEGSGRKRMYRVAERLYSIYYKLRRERDEAAVVENLIRFMTVFYSRDELVGMSGKLTAEAVRSPVIREGLERAVAEGAYSAPPTAGWEVIKQIAEKAALIEERNLEKEIEAALKEKTIEKSIEMAEQAFASRTTASTPMPDSFVALLLNRKATADLGAGNFEAAMAAHDELIERFGVSKVPDLQARVAWALSEKADIQEQLGNLAEAIAACDELIGRFSACSTPELQSWVAHALSRRGDMQEQCKEFGKAIADYDEVVGRFGESDVPELQLAVASTLFRKANLQVRRKEPAAAILSYDEIVRRFGGSDSPWLQVPIAWSLDRKGDAEKGRGDPVAAMAAYEEVIARFADSQVPELQVRVAWALAEKGDIQRRLGNFEAAMAAYEGVVVRYGEDDSSELQMLTARVLFNRADLWSQSGNTSEAIAELGEIVARLGDDDTPGLQYPVALALSQMGMSQIETGNAEGALHTCEDLEARLEILANEEKAEFTWRAMCVRALALMHLKRKPEARQSFRSAYAAFTPGNPTEMGEMLQLVPDLIAGGFTAQELVEILVSDKAKSDALRPLIVALRQHAGEAVRQPVEVLEVAEDIRHRIEDREEPEKGDIAPGTIHRRGDNVPIRAGSVSGSGLELLRRVIGDLSRICDGQWTSELGSLVVRYHCVRALGLLRGIEALLRGGLPWEAAVLNRSLLNLLINLAWLTSGYSRSRVQWFADCEVLTVRKQLDALLLISEISEAEYREGIEELQPAWDEFCEKYGYAQNKKQPPARWAPKPIRGLAYDLEDHPTWWLLWREYEGAYRYLSAEEHTDPRAVLHHLESASGGSTIRKETEVDSETPLVETCRYGILVIVGASVALGMEPEVGALEKELGKLQDRHGA